MFALFTLKHYHFHIITLQPPLYRKPYLFPVTLMIRVMSHYRILTLEGGALTLG